MEVIGIDISKDKFDVWSKSMGHQQFDNSLKGFKEFRKIISKTSHSVMEATGCYHIRLANYLYENDFGLSVVNPLIIKRFIQMKQRRIKTDKSDAKMIWLYGKEQAPALWQPEEKHIEESKLILTVVNLLIKQQTQVKNKLHNLENGGVKKGLMITSLKRQMRNIKSEIKQLEAELSNLMEANESDQMSQLMSIPGLGQKTAILLIVSTNGFRDIENSKQLSAYVGLAPVERSSGSSIRGRSYISKSGNPVLRNHLFMCSFTACQHNPQCKALYDRIVAKGKSKKLALIAVCNKLIKQACGVTKNGLIYDKNYKPIKSA